MGTYIDNDERIVASLPKIWKCDLGFTAFFSKSKEGLLVLTNKKIVFIPQFVSLTPKERGKYFSDDKARIVRINDYSESKLDEDISNNPSSLLISLKSIIGVENTKLRKADFLRIRFTLNGKKKGCDFGITQSVTNYPIRQPLSFSSLDWSEWLHLIKSFQ